MGASELALPPLAHTQLNRAITPCGGNYGLVLISSWQAIVRGLIRDENDNAGAVRVVEDVKAAARLTRIPWPLPSRLQEWETE